MLRFNVLFMFKWSYFLFVYTVDFYVYNIHCVVIYIIAFDRSLTGRMHCCCLHSLISTQINFAFDVSDYYLITRDSL